MMACTPRWSVTGDDSTGKGRWVVTQGRSEGGRGGPQRARAAANRERSAEPQTRERSRRSDPDAPEREGLGAAALAFWVDVHVDRTTTRSALEELSDNDTGDLTPSCEQRPLSGARYTEHPAKDRGRTDL